MSVLVPLTNEQIEAIQPYIDMATEAADEGKPGIVAAQIAGGIMKVGFIPHEKSLTMTARNPDGSAKTLRTFES